MVMVLVLVLGVFSYGRLQRELFPDVSLGLVHVITSYPQSDPATVADEVTSRVEDAIVGLPELETYSSTSTGSLSVVTASFPSSADLNEAEGEIRGQVSGLDLPDGASAPNVVQVTSDVFPVMRLSVSGERDIPFLQRLVDDEIVPRMEAVTGVYDVEVEGGVYERVSVVVDPVRLDEYGLTIQNVVNAVGGNAIDLNAGKMRREGSSVTLRAYHTYSDLDAVRSLPIGFVHGSPAAAGDAQPVLVSDVAEVVIDTPEAETISRTNGQPSVSLSVFRTPDGNTIALTRELLTVIEDLSLPPDVRAEVLHNDGPELAAELGNVTTQGGQGFAVAVMVIFLFLLQLRPSALYGVLNTLRPTVIIALSIPLSLMITILMMWVLGWTLNYMSLAGLAIAVGRIVDDSIVVLENTYRHVHSGEPRATAALRGAREVGAAIVGSTLTTVVVFLPLAFIPGTVGQFFLPFAQTVCVSLVASTFIALTAVPALASLLLREGDLSAEDTANRDTWLQRAYTPVLRWTLGHRLITVGACIVAVAGSLYLVTFLPITLFSAGDAAGIRIDVTMPENTGAGEMFHEVREIETVLQGFLERGYITSYQVTMGATSQGSNQGGYDVAGFSIGLADDFPQSAIAELRTALPQKENVETHLFVDAGGPRQSGLEVNVIGSDFEAVKGAAQDILARIEPLSGVANLKTNVSDASEELSFLVNPSEAGRYGLTSQMVAGQVRAWVYGTDVADINIDGEVYDLVVRGRETGVDEIGELQRLPIGGPAGATRLGAISEVKTTVGPSVVTRYDGNRSVRITGVFEGRDAQRIGARVDQIVGETPLPAGVIVERGGLASDIEEQFANVYLAMLVGVSLVYLVMVATMGSLRDPFIVVLSMPLAIVGSLVALTVTGRALSLPAMMGFLFLVGIVVTNAIVLLTFVAQLREQGYDALEAVVEAGRTRLRPILMTAFTTILALVPLAVGEASGFVGAELATVVIGGLISSTFLTLLAVPVAYMLLYETIPAAPGRIVRLMPRRRAVVPAEVEPEKGVEVEPEDETEG